MKYAAFISYSHRSDERTGRLLETALERFPVAWYGSRRRHVFLDRGDLPASSDLAASLEEAMAASGYLLLIASPEAARSTHVQREVGWWLDHRSLDEILILQSSGVIEFDSAGRLIRTDALPPRLAETLNREPNLVKLPPMPDSGKIDTVNSRWENVLADIVANLDHVDKQDLIGEHIRFQKRWRQIRSTFAGSLLVLLAVAVAATVVAVAQLTEARNQQRIAVARLLLNEAQGTMTSDPQTALRLAEAAEHINPDPENHAGLERLINGTRYAGTLSGHTRTVTAVAFTPDGRSFAASAGDGTTILWDTSDITHPRRVGPAFTAQEDSLTALAFSPSGSLLATADRGGGVILWDAKTIADPRPIGDQLENRQFVTSTAFAAAGTELLCALADGTVKVWDLHDPARPVGAAVLRASASRLRSMVLSGDGTTLATGDADGVVTIWDMTDPVHPTPIGEPLPGNGENRALAISSNGDVVASGGADGTAVVLTRSTRTSIRVGTRSTDGLNLITGLALTPDGRTLIATGLYGVMTVWDLTTGRTKAAYDQPDVKGSKGTTTVALHPSGRTAAVGAPNGVVVLWALENQAQPQRRGPAVTGFANRFVDGTAFAADGRHLIATSGNAVQGFDLTDIDRPAPGVTTHAAGNAMAVSADRRLLVTAGKGIEIDSLDDFGHPTTAGSATSNPSGPIRSVAMSANGTLLASGNGVGEVNLWDLKAPSAPRQIGPPLHRFPGEVNGVALSPDGTTLATASSGIVYKGPGLAPREADGQGAVIVWDVSDPTRPGRLGDPLTGHDGNVRSVAISPNGRTIAYGGDDKKIHIWSIADRHAPRRIGQPLVGHEGVIRSMAFSPDGATLATGADDGAIVLWDVSDLSRPVTQIGSPLGGRSGAVRSLAFTPDGSILAAGAYDGSVVVWDVGAVADSRRSAHARACAASGGGLDRTQWAALVQGLPYEDSCASPE